MLSARKLAKRYGDRVVFRDLDFDVAPSACVAVLGANGAGKSTLLRIVAGLMRPSLGAVTWGETKATAAQLRRYCGLAAPDAPVYRELSVAENLDFFARAGGRPTSAENLQAHLARFELAARQGDLAGDLSSGLRARLQLAVATLHEPPILLLDEPSANLDEAGRALLGDLLQEQRGRGIVLLATNDSRDADRCEAQITL